MTLLEDLEKAATSINRDLAAGDADLAARLRSHAARLREEFDRVAELETDDAVVSKRHNADMVTRAYRAILNRINGGPLGKDELG